MNCAKGERYKHDLPNFQFYTQRWPLNREERDWDTSVLMVKHVLRYLNNIELLKYNKSFKYLIH